MRTTSKDIIAREGYLFILIGVGLALAGWVLHPVLFVLFLALEIFVISFFRNPKRVTPQGKGLVVSPADGTVLSVEEIDEKRFLGAKAKRVCIFMSPANVHVNRIPLEGTVERVSYNKGRFFPAYAEKASLENEQNAIVIKNDVGERFVFIQIAGWLARRIVSYVKEGERWTAGSIYGLIRFGSRMDVYCPVDYAVSVTLGQKVKAGETILARRQ